MPLAVPPTSSSARRHLYWIDWLRFLAAFVVLADHTRACSWVGLDAYRAGQGAPAVGVFIFLFSLGRQAVVLFFVLSGWLVGGHAVERVRAGTFDAVGYAADRLARVYVPLVPTLLLCVAIMRGFDAAVVPGQYVVCLFGLQSVVGFSPPRIDGPLWTLGYEIWFYVLAGGAAVACRRGSTGWQRLAGGVGAGLAVAVCVTLGWVYLACWLVGVAGGSLRERLPPAARPWAAAAGLLAMAAGAAIYQVDIAVLPPPRAGLRLPGVDAAQLLVAVGALGLAASLSTLAPRSQAGCWLERAGGRLAAFSYTLYLVHFPVLVVLREFLGTLPPEINAPAVLRALGCAAACIVVALGMYALFERQTPRVRRWLRARLGGGKETSPHPAAGRRPALATGIS